jgi:hypothetical protein
MTDTLPDNTGYVAAAYLVFVALVLVYVAIVAIRVARLEAEISALADLAEKRAAAPEHAQEALR